VSGVLLATALGLTLGATRGEVQRALEGAGITCRAARGGALECPRALREIDGGAGVRLEFERSRLARAVAAIDPGARTWEAYYGRYQQEKRRLAGEHGEARTSLEYVERQYVLANDQYQAIADGRGEYTSTWQTPEMEIRLSLRGEKGIVRLTLTLGRGRR